MSSIQENISLKPFNTFGIESKAHLFVRFQSVAALQEIIKSDVYDQQRHFVLGGGSNILFTQDVEALVLKNEIRGMKIVEETDTYALASFGAGESWHDCVLWAIEKELAGIENLSLIPGTAGAAPMQNIGAYGVEIRSVIESVSAINKENGELRVFSNTECAFGYRESIFKRELKGQYIITSIVLRLKKSAKLELSYGAIQQEIENKGIANPSIKDVSDVVIGIRQSKLPDPAQIGNAGSFFKNPVVSVAEFEKLKSEYPAMPSYPQEQGVKIPAGWLIEQAGWKGFRDGQIGVHNNQALVLVNYGGGHGIDIYNLSQQIINDVQTRYGIDLQREVNIC